MTFAKATLKQKTLLNRLYHRYTFHDCNTGFLEWKPSTPESLKAIHANYMKSMNLSGKLFL